MGISGPFWLPEIVLICSPYSRVPVQDGAHKGGSCQERPEGERVVEQALYSSALQGGTLQDQAL